MCNRSLYIKLSIYVRLLISIYLSIPILISICLHPPQPSIDFYTFSNIIDFTCTHTHTHTDTHIYIYIYICSASYQLSIYLTTKVGNVIKTFSI